MPVTFVVKPVAVVPPLKAKPKRVYRGTQPKVPVISLDQPGLIRNANFQALLGGLSQAAFYQRRKKGLIPPPDGFDPRPYWRTSTVKAYLTVAV